MYRGYLRYFIGFFITIGLIIILIVLLFGGGNGKKTTTPKTPRSLNSLATTDAQMQLLIDAPVNANEIHKQIRITVGRDKATLDLIHGYENTVADSQSYASNEEAYANFLHALSYAGYTKGDSSKKLADYRGVCSTGTRYVFRVIENGETTSQYWSTTCDKLKTYLGATGQTLTLFQAQIPDYSKLSEDFNSVD